MAEETEVDEKKAVRSGVLATPTAVMIALPPSVPHAVYLAR